MSDATPPQHVTAGNAPLRADAPAPARASIEEARLRALTEPARFRVPDDGLWKAVPK